MSVASNAKWLGLSQLVRVATQLVSMVVLARLLQPSDYGLMAMASVVVNFAPLVRDLGTGAALVQKSELSDQTITAVFWLNMAMGGLIAVAMLLTSPLLASAFGEARLIPVLCILALVFPITSSTTAHQALIERASGFRTLARVETLASVGALGMAIIAAWIGAGVYSLVIQAIAVAVLSSGQLWIASDWRPRGRWNRTELESIARFSGHMTGFQFVTYIFRNVDTMVVGRMLGAASLGVYSMAYKLMLFPVQNITWVASRALFPVMSKQQEALREMAALYLRTVGFIAFVTAPLMAGLFVLRRPFVEAIFGNTWVEVAGILQWLAPVGFLQSILSSTGTVFMALGQTRLLLWLAMAGAATHVVAFILGTRWGLEGVAAGYLVATAAYTAVSLSFALRKLELAPASLARVILPPVCAAAMMLAALELCGAFPRVAALPAQTALPVLAVAGAGMYVGLAFILMRDQVDSFVAGLRFGK